MSPSCVGLNGPDGRFLIRSGQRCIYLIVVPRELYLKQKNEIKVTHCASTNSIQFSLSCRQSRGEALGNVGITQRGLQDQKLQMCILSLGGLFSKEHKSTS